MRTYPLNQSPLYRLQSRLRLAHEVVGLPLTRLESLARRTDNYRLRKRVTSGKERRVHVPGAVLCEVQHRLAALLNCIEVPDYLQSGQRRRSHITNALQHVGAHAVAKLDIRHFYPSITRDRVWHFLVDAMQCSPDVAALLARLCTHRGSAPIGSPVSQVLAFHVARPMLDELNALAEAEGICFTCYVDDLTFSGTGANQEFLDAISAVVRRHGFVPHGMTPYRHDEDKLVTGVLLTPEGARVPPAQLIAMAAARERFLSASTENLRVEALACWVGHLAAAAAVDLSYRLEWMLRRRELKRLLRIQAAIQPVEPMPCGQAKARLLHPRRSTYGRRTPKK